MKTEAQINYQLSCLRRFIQRPMSGYTHAMTLQTINTLEWVLNNGNDPKRTLKDLANFERALAENDLKTLRKRGTITIKTPSIKH